MDKQSPSHTSRDCVRHIVWIPKRRRKVPCNEVRREIGEILAMLVERMDGVEKLEGSACPDRMHICLRIAPKLAVSKCDGVVDWKAKVRQTLQRHPCFVSCGRGSWSYAAA